ncbi:MAG: hypothetical protein ISR57_00055 [Bacteroidales bacterium]|nr:hypothetical protein [Bacteroidota bacterium]MBL6949015.1 hypothetical protein [Bacteroidales bacterium]
MKTKNILVQKLDQFIRKYYANKMIRGLLLSIGIMALCYILFILLENIFRFDSIIRSMLFYLYIGIVIMAVGGWILIPLSSYMKIGKTISHEQAAKIIGDYFSEIEDKLLNALQLIRQQEKTEIDYELLIASIEQKMKKLRVFQFNLVINYRKNVHYLKFVAPPLLIIVLALLITPRLISDPTRRIIEYSTSFKKPHPFSVQLVNENLTVFQQEDLEVRIRVTGEEIPVEFYIETNGIQNRMKRERSREFLYLFRTMQKNTYFSLIAHNFVSEPYLIEVLPRPTILQFAVELTYPAYTRRTSETLENTGDLVVPKGTEITWSFYTKDVDEIQFSIEDSVLSLKKSESNVFVISYRCFYSGRYSVKPENSYGENTDSLSYRIISIEDGYPSIITQVLTDSILPSNLFFSGSIKDDYGFTKLELKFEVYSQDDSTANTKGSKAIEIQNNSREELFYYTIDVESYLSQPGDRMIYYFEIWDNDAVNGPKSTKSEIREINTWSREEIRGFAQENEREIQTELEKSMKETEEIREAIEDLNKKVVDKRQLTWQEKQQIQELIKRNERVLENVEKIKEKNLRNIQADEQFLETSQNILEKQKRLNELMEQLMTDEMRKTIQELKKLMEHVDKKNLSRLMEQMKLSSRDLEEQLDRNLELFKQIEFDRKLEETIRKLKEAAMEQKKLAEKIDEDKKISEEDKTKQNQLNTNYDSIQKALSRLEKMEKELNNQIGLRKTKQKQDSLAKAMKEAKEQVDMENAKAAPEKQMDAAEQMQELANQLTMMQTEAEQDQYAEDARQIRQILENLLNISFEQEELMDQTKLINRNDPKFQDIITDQNELNDKLQSAKDSLIAIGRRQFLLQPVISRDINKINDNINETVESLTSRNMALAISKQQFIMTSINNLAVLLNESMEQMKMNMNMSMQGKPSRMCQNPSMGKGGKSMKDLKKMQQQLSKRLDQIKKGLQEQAKDAGKKGQKGEKGMNEQIARLAAQQEAIRSEMRKYQQQLRERGIGDHGENEAIIEMERNEQDLINKQVTQETLFRQQRILTRLLESEKAEQKREQEERREADEAKIRKYSNPEGSLEYNKYAGGETEILKLSALPVNRFYKSKANRYMIKIVQ